MKSKELIRQLQELDPVGDIEVIGSAGDIYFADLDGSRAETILIHDPKLIGKEYSIVGLQIGQPANPIRPRLILLHQMDLRDVLCDDPDIPVTIYYKSAYIEQLVEDTRKEMKKMHAKSKHFIARMRTPIIGWLEYKFNKFFRWPLKRLFRWLGD